MAVWERNISIPLKKVKHAFPKQVRDNANVPAIVKAISHVNAAIPVLFIVGSESVEHAGFDFRSTSILSNGSNDLDRNIFVSRLVTGLDNLAKGTLPKEAGDLV